MTELTQLEQLQQNLADAYAAYFGTISVTIIPDDDTTAYDAYDRARKELSEYLKEQDK